MTEKRKRLVVIDGKSVFYRGYYAMPNLSTKDGTSTGGVYGFAVMALEVLKRLKPDYVCVAWDKPKTNIRKRLELYPQYKAGRKPPPPDFYAQIPILHRLLDAFGWPLYEMDDYEADDLMGTLAKQAKDADIETLLVTSDLDVLQLVNSHTKAYLLKKGLSNIELLDPESFEKKYELDTSQFLDLKALAGDSSDNIPGVPGVGPKTAIELLKKYKTLDGVYDNLELIKLNTKAKLEDGKELAYLSKKLAEIWTDAPLKLNLKEVDGSKSDPDAIQTMLKELEFRSLLSRLPEVFKLSDAPITGGNNPDLKLGTIYLIETDKQLSDLDLGGPSQVILHTRAAGKQGRNPTVILLSSSPDKVYALKVSGLSKDLLKKKLEPLLAVKKTEIIGYDVKSSIKVGYELGLDIDNVGHDVLIGSFLLNPLKRALSLNSLAQANLEYEGTSIDSLDDEELINRSNEIIAIIRTLYERQLSDLKPLPKLELLAKNIEWKVIPILARMEYTGILLNANYLNEMSVKFADKISDTEQEIYGYADTEFNISSPAQLADVLFNKMKIPATFIKKGKTGYSTAASELDKLRGQHEIIDLITEYRELTKLKSTYVDALPELIDDKSRLHTTFNLTVAQTGRLSSTDPNLQNIPVRTELGNSIRTAFIADPGNVLISADYSQFELRLAAYLADDKELIKQFNNGADIHNMIASQIYGREVEDVTKQMRREAKVINFGILYGMSPHGLSVATGMTQAAAKTFIDKYYELRKPIIDYLNRVKEDARKDGYVENLFGRRRPMPDINSGNFIIRQAAERAAINMPIQGTEADLMKMAMIKVDEKLKSTDSKVLLQIHDSVLVESPEKDSTKIASLLKETMENVYKLPIELTVDTKIAKNWGEL
jgi:DNA polymerase-1